LQIGKLAREMGMTLAAYGGATKSLHSFSSPQSQACTPPRAFRCGRLAGSEIGGAWGMGVARGPMAARRLFTLLTGLALAWGAWGRADDDGTCKMLVVDETKLFVPPSLSTGTGG
jgi:hypothetical protein